MKFKLLTTPKLALISAVLTEIALFTLLTFCHFDDGPIAPMPATYLGMIVVLTQIPGVIVALPMDPTGTDAFFIIPVVNIIVWWIVYFILIWGARKVRRASVKCT